MIQYEVEAEVIVKIKTDFEMDEPPTTETLKFCIDEDLGNVTGADTDCKVVSFCCNSKKA